MDQNDILELQFKTGFLFFHRSAASKIEEYALGLGAHDVDNMEQTAFQVRANCVQ